MIAMTDTFVPDLAYRFLDWLWDRLLKEDPSGFLSVPVADIPPEFRVDPTLESYLLQRKWIRFGDATRCRGEGYFHAVEITRAGEAALFEERSRRAIAKPRPTARKKTGKCAQQERKPTVKQSFVFDLFDKGADTEHVAQLYYERFKAVATDSYVSQLRKKWKANRAKCRSVLATQSLPRDFTTDTLPARKNRAR
jgi:hypothetical protein